MMKTVTASLARALAWVRTSDYRIVLWPLVSLAVLVAVYSTVFDLLMAREDRSYSWLTGLYWTLTTMSTLGYGDITFDSQAGQIFSILVLLSGLVTFLVLLPFLAGRLVFGPWMDRRESARAPRRVPADMQGHIVATGLGSVSQALIARARRARVPHVALVANPQEVTVARGLGYRAMIGKLDDPRPFRNARVDQASLVAAIESDTTNTNVAFTVREINPDVLIAATADTPASVDVLGVAGCDQAVELPEVLGTAMARRVLDTPGRAHRVGEFGSILIAEASVTGTRLAGCTLSDVDVTFQSGVSVLAVHEQNSVRQPDPNAALRDQSVLVLAGTEDQLAAFDRAVPTKPPTEHSISILGGGRVGRVAARVLADHGIPHSIVDRVPGRVEGENTFIGNAADYAVLKQAGLFDASAVLVTTHEDDTNVYLTMYCRRLHPGLRIIARAEHERNVTTLHRAGADSVLSYAAIGATTIWNTLGLRHRVVLSEGVELFTVPIPRRLRHRELRDPKVFEETGCRIVAITDSEHSQILAQDTIPTSDDYHLLVIGNRHDERRFGERYPPPKTA